MSNFQTRLRDRVGRWFGKELAIDETRDLSPHFRRLRVSAPWLQGVSVAPGDKLQIMIAEAGPRTFTPFAHDAAAGTLELLTYAHGDTATAAWLRALAAGAKFHALGPRAALALASTSGPVVLFGDETSFATARALRDARGASDDLAFVFECSTPDEARAVLADLALANYKLIERRADRSHASAIDRELRAALAQHPNAQLVLTGHAQIIQAIRALLKAQPPLYAGQKVKAYWADGKRGLD